MGRGLHTALWPKYWILGTILGCVSVFSWSHLLQNMRFTMFCDNHTVVTIINNTTSKCKNCMALVRMLTLRCLECNMRVFAKWVPGKLNRKSDQLSRQKIEQFTREAKKENYVLDRNEHPYRVTAIVEAMEIWLNTGIMESAEFVTLHVCK